MPHGQKNDLFPVEAVKDHIGALAELDDPFTERRRQIVDRATDCRVAGKDLHVVANCLHSALCCISTL